MKKELELNKDSCGGAMKNQEMEKKYGSVEFGGKKYILSEQADCTSRLLPAPHVNIHEAQEGDEYQSEYAACGIGPKNEHVVVYWIHTNVKDSDLGTDGDAIPDDQLDWDDVDRVETD